MLTVDLRGVAFSRSMFRGAALIVWCALVLGGCRCPPRDEWTLGSFQDQRATRFFEALRRSAIVAEPQHAMWFLETSFETYGGSAWVAEVRDHTLLVSNVEVDFMNGCFLRVSSRATYSKFYPTRAAALASAFRRPPAFDEGVDAPFSSLGAFCGYGGSFSRAVSARGSAETDRIAGMVQGAALPPEELDDPKLFALELAVPWLISRYYSAPR